MLIAFRTAGQDRPGEWLLPAGKNTQAAHREQENYRGSSKVVSLHRSRSNSELRKRKRERIRQRLTLVGRQDVALDGQSHGGHAGRVNRAGALRFAVHGIVE